jgi:hypothetical protein
MQNQHHAFITGSYAYGHPTQESDVDLVVLIEPDAGQQLEELADSNPTGYDDLSFNIRFGKLNIIGLTDTHEFKRWKAATAALKDCVDPEQDNTDIREQAVAVIRACLGKYAGTVDQAGAIQRRES